MQNPELINKILQQADNNKNHFKHLLEENGFSVKLSPDKSRLTAFSDGELYEFNLTTRIIPVSKG